MGWKEGKGLGKNHQGTNSNLRAVRREEGLGIGAKTDLFGEDGFSKTSQNFHGVLANLHVEHGINNGSKNNSDSNDDSEKSKKKKKKDKNAKLEKSESGLTLSKNKVTAGHAKKMRESKDLTKKSKEDMAAIFGMKVEQYQKNSVWGRLSSLTSSSDNGKEKDEIRKSPPTSDNESKKKRKEEKKKRKRKDKEEDTQEIDDSEKKSKKSKKKRKKEES